MSLVADYGSETSSSSGSESDNTDTEENTKSQTIANASVDSVEKLPTPDFGNSSGSSASVKTSVFSNPFIEAENAKKAMLEKHVKMVNSKDNVNVINGKKICWNYRKGRCRFGHKCSFAHDSDLQKSKEELESETQPQQTLLCSTTKRSGLQTDLATDSDGDGSKVVQKKKKRPGLSQTIAPGQKVMKMYHKQKLKEGQVIRTTNR